MEFNNTQSIYLQIAQIICEKILRGVLKPEERISSVRDLAVELEVNPNTILRTYEFLVSLDIISNKRGIGYFVTPDGYKKATEYKKQNFLNTELPELFKTVALLNLDFNELKEKYTLYLADLKNKTNE